MSKIITFKEPQENDQQNREHHPSELTLIDQDIKGRSIKNETGKEESLHYEDLEMDADLLETVLFYLGEFGIYQKIFCVVMFFPTLYFSWVYLSHIFVLVTPMPFWCNVTELANLTKERRKELSTPANDAEWDGCYVYDTDWKAVLTSQKPPSPSTATKRCTTGWEFSYEEIPYSSIVSEFSWVCGTAHYVPKSQTIFFIGSMVGGLIFGFIADRYGRIPAIVGVNFVGGIGGVGAAFSTSYWDYFLWRFISGISYDGCFLIAYILVLEFVGPSYRTLMATVPLVLYDGTSAIALPWLAYYIANWRIFAIVTSVPMFVMLLSPWVLPESIRWLVDKGRIDKAVKVLRKFERVNRTKIPDTVMEAFINSSKEMNEKRTNTTMLILFSNKLLGTTTILMMLTYSICACAYDVIVRLCGSFGFDVFITFTINSAAEIPSYLVIIVLLDRLGRRNLTWGPLLLAAVCLVIAMFVPKGILRVIFACMARVCISITFSVVIQWATEILPTPIRASAASALHITGFAASCLSPFIVYSERIFATLPLIIILVMIILVAAMSLTLPETKGLELPQTIADTQTIILEYSLLRSPETKDVTEALSKLVKVTVSEPVIRSKEGRVTAILSGHSKMSHSKLSMLNLESIKENEPTHENKSNKGNESNKENESKSNKEK